MKFPRLLRTVGSVAMIALAAGAVHAQSWPTKPVRLLVGSPPGGPSDITARTFADQLGKRIGQRVVVENRPGAGNNLAAAAAARAEPDGTTLVLSPDTGPTANPLVYSGGGSGAARGLVNMSFVADCWQRLVCDPHVGVRSVAELAAKAKAGPLMYASGGPGVPGHLATEMVLEVAKVRMEHV